MNVQKFVVSGIVGGIVSFLGGYLLYGKLLMDYFSANAITHVMRPMTEIVWWSLVIGCIFTGLLFSYIFNKWANIHSAGAGASAGFVIGLLMTAGTDLTMYGTASLSTLQGTLVDILCGAVLSAVTGAVVGWMNGMGKKTAAA